MPIYTLDPRTDPRWEHFLERHPQASLFHSTAWLQALYDSYGYISKVHTEAAAGEALQNGLLSCKVSSWATGSRRVSMPFSDFCDPLVRSDKELHGLLSAAAFQCAEDKDRYLELRLTKNRVLPERFKNEAVYFWHRLDLSPTLEQLYKSFHKNHVQRKIRRAEKEELVYQVGSTPALLKQFYDLFLFNRRKHQVPPQPFEWFQQLLKRFKNKMQIHLASYQNQPIAAIITFNYGNVCYYKYGSSNPNYTHLGSNALLFWKAIQMAKQAELTGFDMGRSDINPAGFSLAKYKENWGAERQAVRYWRLEPRESPPAKTALALPNSPIEENPSTWRRFAKAIIGRLPDKLLILSGRLLYRHMG